MTDIAPQQVSGSNRHIYERLKQALSIHLRRQIFIAACDDLCLRDCLAARLQAELINGEAPREIGEGTSPSSPDAPTFDPQFVSLPLNLSDPNPIAQIVQWFAEHPTHQAPNPCKRILGFQILGVEHLTRQPPAVQWSFLSYLRDIEHTLPGLEFSLLLWVPRPWLCSIQQSAPEFWRWRTGVFEFEGEPTPATRKEEEVKSEDREITPSPKSPTSLHRLIPPSLPLPPSSAWERNSREGSTTVPAVNNGTKAPELSSTGSPTLPGNSGEGSQNPPGEKGEARSPVASVTAVLPSRQPETLCDRSFSLPLLKSTELADLILAEAERPDVTRQAFWPLETLQYIALLQEQQCSPQKLAVAYQMLGNYYRTRIAANEVSHSHLAIAIHAYEQVWEWRQKGEGPESAVCLQLWQEFQQSFTQGSHSPMVALAAPEETLNDLGTLYWMLSRYPHPTQQRSALERSIGLYQQAMAATGSQTPAQIYALLHKNLGAAYADLARCQHPAENWQRSALAYQEALLHLDALADPQHYAATLNNLGTAYWNLAQYAQPITQLKSAIAAYTAALLHYNPEEQPLNYAGVQNNLGTAYWNLAQHEPSEALLSKAVDAYQEALKYRTEKLVPAASAATQNNLGTAYWHLAQQLPQKQARVECWQQAIAAYQTALRVAESLAPTQLSFDLLATHNNLGLAHYQLATDSQAAFDETAQRTHLEAALTHQLQAYQGWQSQHDHSKATKPFDREQAALSSIVKTIRSFYSECGLQGQNFALSKVPGDLLPEILRRL